LAQLETIDLLVVGAAELATPTGTRARGGAELAALQVLPRGALAIRGERILATGPEPELVQRFRAVRTLDARGGTLVPGFVDAHTHPVFAATREEEFELRTRGQSYLEIARAGGGILSSVRGVRAATREELLELLLLRLQRFLALGTTTIEAKSGYGLSLADELKSLEVIAEANRCQSIECVATFLGAHDVPAEYKGRREEYVTLVCEEMLPRVAERGLAQYCDAFTEAHTFDLADTRRLFVRARELGLGLRLHADQLSALGGAELAAELGAASADHLEHVSRRDLDALAAAGTRAVLLPVASFTLDQRPPPVAEIRAADVGMVVASDANPGTAPTESLPLALAFAVRSYGFSPDEALLGATREAAHALLLGDRVGTLAPGFDADLVVWSLPHEHVIVQPWGVPKTRLVLRGGQKIAPAAPALP